jgi:hypothetical protein
MLSTDVGQSYKCKKVSCEDKSNNNFKIPIYSNSSKVLGSAVESVHSALDTFRKLFASEREKLGCSQADTSMISSPHEHEEYEFNDIMRARGLELDNDGYKKVSPNEINDMIFESSLLSSLTSSPLFSKIQN